MDDLNMQLDLCNEEKEQIQFLSNQKLDIAANKIKQLVSQVKDMHNNYEDLNNENHELKMNEIKLIKTITQLKALIEQQQLKLENNDFSMASLNLLAGTTASSNINQFNQNNRRNHVMSANFDRHISEQVIPEEEEEDENGQQIDHDRSEIDVSSQDLMSQDAMYVL